jgi:hypothetical protein
MCFVLRSPGVSGLPRPSRRVGTGVSRTPRASSAGTKGLRPSVNGPGGAALTKKRNSEHNNGGGRSHAVSHADPRMAPKAGRP